MTSVQEIHKCVSDVLLHLEKIPGIVFALQSAQIWPKDEKKCFFSFQNVPKGVRVLLAGGLRFAGKTRIPCRQNTNPMPAKLKPHASKTGTPCQQNANPFGYILEKHFF